MVGCCKVFGILVVLALLGYLVYCVIAIPQYRWAALLILPLLPIYAFSLWRFLPSERRWVNQKAKKIVRKRLGPMYDAQYATSPIRPTNEMA